MRDTAKIVFSLLKERADGMDAYNKAVPAHNDVESLMHTLLTTEMHRVADMWNAADDGASTTRSF